MGPNRVYQPLLVWRRHCGIGSDSHPNSCIASTRLRLPRPTKTQGAIPPTALLPIHARRLPTRQPLITLPATWTISARIYVGRVFAPFPRGVSAPRSETPHMLPTWNHPVHIANGRNASHGFHRSNPAAAPSAIMLEPSVNRSKRCNIGPHPQSSSWRTGRPSSSRFAVWSSTTYGTETSICLASSGESAYCFSPNHSSRPNRATERGKP